MGLWPDEGKEASSLMQKALVDLHFGFLDEMVRVTAQRVVQWAAGMTTKTNNQPSTCWTSTVQLIYWRQSLLAEVPCGAGAVCTASSMRCQRYAVMVASSATHMQCWWYAVH